MFNQWYKKIAYRTRCLTTDVVCQLGGKEWWLKESAGVRILLYHGIDKIGRTDINGRFIGVKAFEAQIKYLKTHFHILPLADLFAGKIMPHRMNVALCFDDGYRNNLTLALPVLERYQVPAAFFLTAIRDTDYPMLWADYLDLASLLSSQPIQIEEVIYTKRKGEYYHPDGQKLKSICKQRSWSFKQLLYTSFPEAENLEEIESLKVYWEQLSIEEIRQLDQSPMADIGVHAYVHDNLELLPHGEACQRLQQAKRFLETVLDRPLNSLAYADGSYTRELIDHAQLMGFDSQYAVDFRYNEDQTDKRIMNRLTVNPYISLNNQIRAILSGQY